MPDATAIHVAVVDDDAAVSVALGRLLRSSGMRVDLYPSAEAFFDRAQRPHYDCLLLDVFLSGMSGLELQRRLVDARVSVPIVFLTAHDDCATRTAAIGAGCVAFFGKTVAASELLGAIYRGAAAHAQQRAEARHEVQP